MYAIPHTYIENISAPENIEVTTQGNSLYVKNLDNTSNTAETQMDQEERRYEILARQRASSPALPLP